MCGNLWYTHTGTRLNTSLTDLAVADTSLSLSVVALLIALLRRSSKSTSSGRRTTCFRAGSMEDTCGGKVGEGGGQVEGRWRAGGGRKEGVGTIQSRGSLKDKTYPVIHSHCLFICKAKCEALQSEV